MGRGRDERYGGVGCFQMSEPEDWEEVIHQEESEDLEWMKSQKAAPFKGKIPPIAEKEKRGKKVKIPPSEIYVQELTTNAGNNSNNS